MSICCSGTGCTVTCDDFGSMDDNFCIGCFQYTSVFRCFSCCNASECEECEDSHHQCDCVEDEPCFEDLLSMEEWTRRFLKRVNDEDEKEKEKSPEKKSRKE